MLRPASPTDLGYVVHTWREVVRVALSARHGERAERFNHPGRTVIERVLSRSAILVAGPPDDPRTVYGFIVQEPGCVHIAYVKKALRRLGIGATLVEGSGIRLGELAKPDRDFESQLAEAIPMVRYGPLWFGGAMTEASKGRKVVSITTREGGVDVSGPTGNRNWTTVKAGPEAAGVSASPAIELELDSTMAGVLVRYKSKGEPRTVLVPMSHIRQLELAG